MSGINFAIDQKIIQDLHQNFKNQSQHQVLTRAITNNGINQTAFDFELANRLTPTFNVENPVGKVAAQKHSGRCWLFATTNLLRHSFEKQHRVTDFDLSQKYLFFWDKIERANIFYQRMIATASQKTTDREVAEYLSGPGNDGGQWAMATSLVKKYGVVPQACYPDTINVENTDAFHIVMNKKLRQDALTLRKLVNDNQSDEVINQARLKALKEVYQIAAYSFGEPPMTVNYDYVDTDNQYHSIKDITPVEFLQREFAVNLDDYVVLLNSPEKDYYKHYTLHSQDNVVAADPVEFINLPMTELKQCAIQQLQAKENVWFGCDVLQQMDRNKGLLASDLFKYAELFGVKLNMSKKERILAHDANISHAMLLVGVDLKDEKPTKWKVENSWGGKIGNDGFFVMADSWMDEYVFEMVINKQYLTESQLAVLDEPAVALMPWDFA